MTGLKRLSLTKIELILFYLLILFLPTQLGKHFWPDFSIVSGIRIDYLSPTLYLTDILIALLFVFWLGANRDSVAMHIGKSKRAFTLYWSFVVFLCFNICLSGNQLNGFYHLLKFLEFSFVAYYVATTVGRMIHMQTTSCILAIGVVGESLLAIAQYFLHGSVGGLLYFLGERTFTADTPGIANASINGELVMRAYGTFPHPNVLAGYLLVSMILIFGYLLPSKIPWQRTMAFVGLLIGTGALLLSLSRVAIALWSIFLIGLIAREIFFVKSRKLRFHFAHVLPLLGFIFLAGVFIEQTVSPRFLQTSFSDQAVVQREDLLKAAIDMVSSHPFFGIGLGNFLPTLATLRSPLSLDFYLQPVHNIFFLVAAETGIVGLLIFVGFLVVISRKLISKRDSILLLVFVNILFLGFDDHYWLTLQQGQLLFSLIVGLSCVKKSLSVTFGCDKKYPNMVD